MQSLAAEFNLSETTFVLPPAESGEHRAGAHLQPPRRDAVRRPSQCRHRLGAGAAGPRQGRHAALRGDRRPGRDRGRASTITIAAPQPLSLGPEMPVELVAGCVGLSTGPTLCPIGSPVRGEPRVHMFVRCPDARDLLQHPGDEEAEPDRNRGDHRQAGEHHDHKYSRRVKAVERACHALGRPIGAAVEHRGIPRRLEARTCWWGGAAERRFQVGHGGHMPTSATLQSFPVLETGRAHAMPVIFLLILALVAGSSVGLVTWRYPRGATAPPASPAGAARKVGEAVGRHSRLRAIRDARFDPAAATGLALTLALLFAIGGGLVLGVLAYLVRSNGHLIGVDNGVAKWGNRHASAASTHALNAITQLGGIYTIVVLCLVLAVFETIRERSVWVVPFITAVVGGEEILTLTVKQLADRVRPTFNPAAATLGPSFPSGHSATAAAFYADRGALARTLARPAGASAARRTCRRDRRGGRREPCSTRRALGLGRDRRAGARLGLVLQSVRSRSAVGSCASVQPRKRPHEPRTARRRRPATSRPSLS